MPLTATFPFLATYIKPQTAGCLLNFATPMATIAVGRLTPLFSDAAISEGLHRVQILDISCSTVHDSSL